MPPQWNTEEQLLCVACIEVCDRADGLDRDKVPGPIKLFGFSRNLKAIQKKLRGDRRSQLKKMHPKPFVSSNLSPKRSSRLSWP
jgi:hypothetical protein